MSLLSLKNEGERNGVVKSESVDQSVSQSGWWWLVVDGMMKPLCIAIAPTEQAIQKMDDSQNGCRATRTQSQRSGLAGLGCDMWKREGRARLRIAGLRRKRRPICDGARQKVGEEVREVELCG